MNRTTRLACAVAGIAPVVAGVVLVAQPAGAAPKPEIYTGHVEVVRGQDGDAPALGDPHLVTEDELGESWLTANFYTGSSDSRVKVSVDGRAAKAAEHTQPMQGEALNTGWEFSDPAAATRNLLSSGSVTRSSAHLWTLPVPAGLEPGTHTAEVTATDHRGREFTDTMRFTVSDQSR